MLSFCAVDDVTSVNSSLCGSFEIQYIEKIISMHVIIVDSGCDVES
jgi:hypothetical protein